MELSNGKLDLNQTLLVLQSACGTKGTVVFDEDGFAVVNRDRNVFKYSRYTHEELLKLLQKWCKGNQCVMFDESKSKYVVFDKEKFYDLVEDIDDVEDDGSYIRINDRYILSQQGYNLIDGNI